MAGDLKHFRWLATKLNLAISIYRHLSVFKLKKKKAQLGRLADNEDELHNVASNTSY